MAANKFREDLYYRLNIFPIVMPDLSKRKDEEWCGSVRGCGKI